MPTVKGIWTFKDVLTEASIWEEVNFSTDGESYSLIHIDGGAVAPFLTLNYGWEEDGDTNHRDVYAFEEYDDGFVQIGWYSDAGKTIDFGETEQTVSTKFYEWLVENAVQAVENIKIDATKNGTITLATAGKYCDRNIDVNVEVSSGILSDADELAQGTISGGYVSDKVTSLRYGAFYSCSKLTAVSLPNCTSIAAYSFAQCANIENIDLPMCTTIRGGNTFDSATKLKTINLPNLTTITDANRTFVSCTSLVELNAPNLISMVDTNRLFGVCKALKKVAFPKLGGVTINAYTFYNCTNLETLVLGGDTLNPLENVNAFSKIPNIYVKDNLVDTYKTATNWSNFADQIKPISELEE